MSNLKVCFSHKSDDWKTPSWLYDYFISLGFLDLFPYKAKFNQFLRVNYKGQNLFINPPYSKMDLVSDYIELLYQHNNRIALLIPARTDTKYFHKLLKLNPIIIFLEGRLHFNDSKECAPFPSMILLFDKNNFFDNNYYCSISRGEFPFKGLDIIKYF